MADTAVRGFDGITLESQTCLHTPAHKLLGMSGGLLLQYLVPRDPGIFDDEDSLGFWVDHEASALRCMGREIAALGVKHLGHRQMRNKVFCRILKDTKPPRMELELVPAKGREADLAAAFEVYARQFSDRKG